MESPRCADPDARTDLGSHARTDLDGGSDITPFVLSGDGAEQDEVTEGRCPRQEGLREVEAATTNGSPITRYLVDIGKGNDKTAGAKARKTVFKRLKPGRYRIRIGAAMPSEPRPTVPGSRSESAEAAPVQW